MDKATFQRICCQLKKLPQCFVIPQGAGESSLHPDLIDMLTQLKRIPGVSVGFNTNGILMTKELAQALIDIQIDELGFSIDANSPDEFLTITGKDAYQQVEQNLLTFIEERSRRGATRPKLRTLLVDANYPEDYLTRYLEKWLPLTGEVVIQAERIGTGRLVTRSYAPRERRQPCMHLWRTAFIQYDGNVTICCDDWNSELIVGNVLSQDLGDLWFGTTMAQVRRAHMQGDWAYAGICRGCESWVDRQVAVRATAEYSLVVEPLLMRFMRRGAASWH